MKLRPVKPIVFTDVITQLTIDQSIGYLKDEVPSNMLRVHFKLGGGTSFSQAMRHQDAERFLDMAHSKQEFTMTIEPKKVVKKRKSK